MRLQILTFMCLLVACATSGEPGVPPGSGAASGGMSGNGAGSAGLSSGGSNVGGSNTGGSSAGGASGTGTGGASGTDTGGTGFGGGAGDSSKGCGSTTLLPIPNDPALRGPWKVGVRTVKLGRLTTELYYPAEPGSTDGKPETTYDIREWLPPQEKAKVPDANSPAVSPVGKNLFRDVPLDGSHGPYPVVIMIHGTASFRAASASITTHWASRGFVVVAADYPGLGLTDQLNGACAYPQTAPQDIPGDVNTQIAALKSAAAPLDFLSGHIDMTRLGMSGHSQGACISATLSTLPGVQVVVAMTGSTAVSASTSLKSAIYIAGIADTVIGYDTIKIGNFVCPNFPFSNVTAYDTTPGPPAVTKRIVGITGGGHLVPTDLCQKNAQGRNAIQEAQMDGVCGINTAVIIGLPALFDCGTIDMETGIKAVNYASAAALEETLHCKDRSGQFEKIKANVPEVGDFRHAP